MIFFASSSVTGNLFHYFHNPYSGGEQGFLFRLFFPAEFGGFRLALAGDVLRFLKVDACVGHAQVYTRSGAGVQL